MTNTNRTTQIIISSIALLLVGCTELDMKEHFESMKAALSDDSSGSIGESTADWELTPAEQRLREQSRNFNKTVWQGALLGTATGFAIGKLSGDDTKDAMKKALIGGVAGTIAGAYVAHKQKQYANREDQLDSITADVKQLNRQAAEYNASASEVLAEDKRSLAAAKKKYHQGTITKEELKNEQARAMANRKNMEDSLADWNKRAEMFEGAEREYAGKEPNSTGELRSELKSLHGQIDTLDTIVDELGTA